MRPGVLASRHQVYRISPEDESSQGIAGCAMKYEDETYFYLKLNLLQRSQFYIVKGTNPFGPEFTVCSQLRRKKVGRTLPFYTVGEGGYSADKNSIEFSIADLKTSYRLILDPTDFHFTGAKVA